MQLLLDGPQLAGADHEVDSSSSSASTLNQTPDISCGARQCHRVIVDADDFDEFMDIDQPSFGPGAPGKRVKLVPDVFPVSVHRFNLGPRPGATGVHELVAGLA
jgi:hypothetical protein